MHFNTVDPLVVDMLREGSLVPTQSTTNSAFRVVTPTKNKEKIEGKLDKYAILI